MGEKAGDKSVEEKSEGKNEQKKAGKRLGKMAVILCGVCLDVGLILYVELIQLTSILTLVNFWGNQLNELYIIETLAICIFPILLLRHFAIKGMPSTKLRELVEEALKIKKG